MKSATRFLIAFAIVLVGMSASADEKASKGPKLTGPKPPAIEKLSPAEIDQSIDRGVEFLLNAQNKDGSWGSARRTKGLNIYAPVPGAHRAFRTAVTALCVCALIELDSEREDVRKSLERGEKWILENLSVLRRATADAIYNVWGHGYAIQALVRMHGRMPKDAERKQKIETLIKQQFDLLSRYESVDGGWGYYDFRAGTKKPSSSSISFTNAAILVAFREAHEIGIKPPQKIVDRAVAATLRQRLPNFSYLYGEYLKYDAGMGINRPGGSLGRSQACNYALKIWGDEKVTPHVMEVWLDRLFARNGWLDVGRKRPIPHESWFQVAGYFYYFGHYYAARCIEDLKTDRKPFFQNYLASTLIRIQEKDGSWWDYPFYDYHQPYGTAFAVMSLLRCRPELK